MRLPVELMDDAELVQAFHDAGIFLPNEERTHDETNTFTMAVKSHDRVLVAWVCPPKPKGALT